MIATNVSGRRPIFAAARLATAKPPMLRKPRLFISEPNRAACGAWHDDVNFATGVNHPNGPQPDDIP